MFLKIETAELKEWWLCVKFCFLLGKSAFKDEAMGKTQLY
jgi:hypothetical protein